MKPNRASGPESLLAILEAAPYKRSLHKEEAINGFSGCNIPHCGIRRAASPVTSCNPHFLPRGSDFEANLSSELHRHQPVHHLSAGGRRVVIGRRDVVREPLRRRQRR